jgi:hypothetical protein
VLLAHPWLDALGMAALPQWLAKIGEVLRDCSEDIRRDPLPTHWMNLVSHLNQETRSRLDPPKPSPSEQLQPPTPSRA